MRSARLNKCRSTKAGTPTRRHPRPARRDRAPRRARLSFAQRRPGLQPGDTRAAATACRVRARCTFAQRRPGLQPGDTLPDPPVAPSSHRDSGGRSTKAGTPTRRHPMQDRSPAYRRSRTTLNEGRDSNPATPPAARWQRSRACRSAAQRRPGLQPGDTLRGRVRRALRRTVGPLNEGRDSNPATPSPPHRRNRSPTRAASALNEGRDSNPATPDDRSLAKAYQTDGTALNEGRDSNPATPQQRTLAADRRPVLA